MRKLKIEQINEIIFFGKANIDGSEYRYKDYLYKSEIYKDGKLFARIDNKKPDDDESRVEYMIHYCVEYTDPETGATSPIDNIYETEGYTAADYIRDCDNNSDDDYCQMIKRGKINLYEVEE